MGIMLSLTLSVVATGVLSDLWSKEWSTLRLSFQVSPQWFLQSPLLGHWAYLTYFTCSCFPCKVTAPFLHLGGVMLMTALAWPVASHLFRMKSPGAKLGKQSKWH